MEVVRWHSDLGDLEVNVLAVQVIIRSVDRIVSLRIHVLQESLDVTSRVLRAGTVEAVWKEEYHTTLPKPLGLRAHQVLVYNKLCGVVKITELSLPKTEVLWVLKRITILIGHGAEFVEVRVEHMETALGVCLHELRVLKRGGELASAQGVLIMKHCMSVRECASFDVFSDNSNIVSIYGKRTASHCLSSGPVDLVLLEGFQSVGNVHPLQPLVRLDAGRVFN